MAAAGGLLPSAEMHYAAFGQGLHETESRLAARLALRLRERRAVRQALLTRLPQDSPHTRERLADKLLQRLLGGATPRAALRLLADLPDRRARRQLLLHRIAATDRLVGAIARDLFHRYFVRGQPPTGMTLPQFLSANCTGLFGAAEPNGLLRGAFVATHARRAWGVPTTSAHRALTILRQCGVLARLPLERDGAYLPTGVPPALPVFTYLLHEEVLWPAGGHSSVRGATAAPFLRLFVLRPPLPTALLTDAAEAGLLSSRGSGVVARFDDPEHLVERLLAV